MILRSYYSDTHVLAVCFFLESDGFNRRSVGRSSLMETSMKMQLDSGMRVLSRKVFHEEIVLLFTVASGNIKVRYYCKYNFDCGKDLI